MGAQMIFAVQKDPSLQPKADELETLRNKLDDAIAEEAKKYQYI
jgi:hypothetical protein